MFYSEEEKKLIKQELSWGYVFLLILGGFTLLFNLFYYILLKEKYIEPKYPISMCVNSGMFVLTVSVFYLLTRKAYKDLREQQRIIKYETIQKKESEITFDEEIVNLQIRIFKRKVIKSIKYYLIINNVRYVVDKEVFEKFEENEKIKTHYAENTNIVLGYKKMNEI